MKPMQRYKVCFNPIPEINCFMRATDFFKDGEGIALEEIFVVTWKEGEVVDEARIKAMAENIRKALEHEKFEVFSVEAI
jgi:hypothetical protein